MRRSDYQDFELKNNKIDETKLTNYIYEKLSDDKFKSTSTNSEVDKDNLQDCISKGINGEESPLYDEIKSYLKDNDKLLFHQLHSHESGVIYEKKAEKQEEKANKYHKKAEKHHEKTPNKKTKYKLNFSDEGPIIIKHQEKLKMGERNTKQKLQYQGMHQAKNFVLNDFYEAEQNEGNDGVRLVHSGASKLKEKFVKPFIRKHTPFGFDRHQYLEEKNLLKEKKSIAKKDTYEKISNTKLSNNSIKKEVQKRQIRKQMYKKHGLKLSLRDRVRIGVKGVYNFINPFRKVKAIYHIISTIFSAFFGLIKILIFVIVFIVLIIIPVIVVMNIFSIFFNFGNDDKDPQIHITDITENWSNKIINIKQTILDSEISKEYDGKNYDEIRVDHSSLSVNIQNDLTDQIEIIGYLSSKYQEELNRVVAYFEIEVLFLYAYRIEAIESTETRVGVSFDEELEEYVEVEYDVNILTLTLKKHSIPTYVDLVLEMISDEDDRDLAKTQMSNYRETYGLNQFINNPFLEDWRTSVSSLYGYRYLGGAKDFHTGLDIAKPIGTSIYAPGDNLEVVEVLGGCPVYGGLGNDCNGGGGNKIVIKQIIGDFTYYIRYLHLENIYVSVGDIVTKDTVIGTVGSSGNSTGAHLHLGVKNGNDELNPLFLTEWD